MSAFGAPSRWNRLYPLALARSCYTFSTRKQPRRPPASVRDADARRTHLYVSIETLKSLEGRELEPTPTMTALHFMFSDVPNRNRQPLPSRTA